MNTQMQLQIGKKGLTSEFIEDVRNRLEEHRNATVRIAVLKSARSGKEDVKKYADELTSKLGTQYTAKTLGFTVLLKKWRKARVSEAV